MPSPTAPDARNRSSTNRKWNELLEGLIDLASREMEAAGLPTDTARDISVSVADALAESFGGILIYVPRNSAKKTAARDEEIYQQLGTIDAQTLAMQFGVGIHAIYRAAQRAKARRKASSAPHRIEPA